MKKRIVCFGDSNTWGLNAETMERFSEEIRWPCLLQEKLGDDYQIIEEGLPGRTAVCDDPLLEGMKGLDYIVPCLKSHAPLELVIIMLGTNDTKERFGLTAHNIAQGIVRLAEKAKNTETGHEGNPPTILVVAPPAIDEAYNDTDIRRSMGKDCDTKSKELPKYIEEFLTDSSIHFLDASKAVSMNKIDYMHLDETGHSNMAKIIFEKLSSNFKKTSP